MNSHLSAEELKELKSRLLEEKASIENMFEHTDNFGMAESLKDSLDEFAMYDNHPADIGTELFERGKDYALNEHEELRLENVNEALARMESGEYGTCKVCGRPISVERLQALPETSYCLEHADKIVSARRPVEEEILSPPFGRTSLDELETSQNQFDGEDAWQIVESWGNSDSPAMAEDPQVTEYNEMMIENDEKEGFVEPLESFLATDMYGNHVMVVRNSFYKEYMEAGEGEGLLEPEPYRDLDE